MTFARALDPRRDMDQIRANAAAVQAQMPELVPEIKALLAAGLIDGWRNVVYIGPPQPVNPGAVPGTDVMLGTFADALERTHGNHR